MLRTASKLNAVYRTAIVITESAHTDRKNRRSGSSGSAKITLKLVTPRTAASFCPFGHFPSASPAHLPPSASIERLEPTPSYRVFWGRVSILYSLGERIMTSANRSFTQRTNGEQRFGADSWLAGTEKRLWRRVRTRNKSCQNASNDGTGIRSRRK